MYSQYLSDPEIKALTSDQVQIRQMLRVEIALAKVQATLGIIPDSSASEIDEKLRDLVVDPADLAAGTLRNGIPTIPLLARAKKHLSPEAADHLHWGATSQDILDTALVLTIREIQQVLKQRLEQIVRQLTALVERYDRSPMAGRTRTQQAVPITFGQKLRQWLQPLQRHLDRLESLKLRLSVVQLGGAAGNLDVLGEQGPEVARRLARELGLGYIGTWHSQRDNLAEWASWLALLSGSLGKMAGDVLLQGQTEIGEVMERKIGGGSSTMPHKNNPVLSEAIVALAHYTALLSPGPFQAMSHRQERDGAAWALEWLTLPPMMIATGTALRHVLTISKEMIVNTDAMRANLEKLNGLIFSERAGFLLTSHMSRSQAKKLVESACELVNTEGIHLSEALTKLAPEVEIDWKTALSG